MVHLPLFRTIEHTVWPDLMLAGMSDNGNVGNVLIPQQETVCNVMWCVMWPKINLGEKHPHTVYWYQFISESGKYIGISESQYQTSLDASI